VVNEMIEVMKQAAREAGLFMINATDRGHTEKTNAKDFVTVADIKSQDILRDFLKKSYPDTQILSEEDDEATRKAMFAPNFTGFILDPIDGTYNFKRDMKESAISIGYIENGQITRGVIFDPYKDELYETEKGKGAFCNEKPIRVSDQGVLSGASVATSNSYDDEAMARNLKRHMGIFENTGTMPWTSCPGSGVLIMAWVACGRIDAYHHNGLKPWDNAAAFLLVREAGGEVQTLEGEIAPFTSATVLMGNAQIVRTLRGVFENLPQELLA
jgi:myo-inositol-1(or 4)-monophosphatase